MASASACRRRPAAWSSSGAGPRAASASRPEVTDQDRKHWRSLNHKEEFHEVYERGAKRVGRLLVVYLLPAGDTARAVVASRKVGGAVQRNRAKRLLREALRQGPLADLESIPGVRARFFPETGGPEGTPAGGGGLWIVLVARQHILTAGAQDVLQELEALLAD